MKEKRSLIPRGCTVPSLEMRRISCLLRLSLLPEMGYTYTAGYTVNEMGGSAREIVLDIVNEFGCRNDSGGIINLLNKIILLNYKLKFYTSQIPRSETLTNPVTNVTENNQIPLVLTLH